MTSPAQAGRPRDPDVDRRVADAAITLFGETGWAGFSVEAVAKQASVGKASIYLRWPTKEALLADTEESGREDREAEDERGVDLSLIHI